MGRFLAVAVPSILCFYTIWDEPNIQCYELEYTDSRQTACQHNKRGIDLILRDTLHFMNPRTRNKKSKLIKMLSLKVIQIQMFLVKKKLISKFSHNLINIGKIVLVSSCLGTQIKIWTLDESRWQYYHSERFLVLFNNGKNNIYHFINHSLNKLYFLK